MAMATRSGTPARTKLRSPVRRKSWLVFGIFASIAEFERELQGKRIGRPRRPVDTSRVRDSAHRVGPGLRSQKSSVPGSAQCIEQVNKRYTDFTTITRPNPIQ